VSLNTRYGEISVAAEAVMYIVGGGNEMFIVISVSISKSMAKCKINIDTDFTDYTDFHNHY